MIVCIAPNPSIDKLFVTDELKPGTVHRPDRLIARAGGKGLNVARAAKTLGADVTVVALLAGHAGRWIADELEDAGVATEAVWAHGENRSALSVAASGTLTEFYERGSSPGNETWATFVERAAAVAGRGQWASVTGSLPAEIRPEEAATLVRAARAAGTDVAVDMHDVALKAAVAEGPKLVKVNRREAEAATGHHDPLRSIRALNEAQAQAGVDEPITIVTLGADRGALLLEGDELTQATLGVRGPYPTGSGDAFLAGVLHARIQGATWQRALAVAAGAGAANAETEGAGTLEPTRAEALAGEVTVAPA
jgi:1-phosphofructokinase family hexose kinase